MTEHKAPCGFCDITTENGAVNISMYSKCDEHCPNDANRARKYHELQNGVVASTLDHYAERIAELEEQVEYFRCLSTVSSKEIVELEKQANEWAALADKHAKTVAELEECNRRQDLACETFQQASAIACSGADKAKARVTDLERLVQAKRVRVETAKELIAELEAGREVLRKDIKVLNEINRDDKIRLAKLQGTLAAEEDAHTDSKARIAELEAVVDKCPSPYLVDDAEEELLRKDERIADLEEEYKDARIRIAELEDQRTKLHIELKNQNSGIARQHARYNEQAAEIKRLRAGILAIDGECNMWPKAAHDRVRAICKKLLEGDDDKLRTPGPQD